MSRLSILMVATLSCGMVLSAAAQGRSDEAFARKAVAGGQAEVECAVLAVQRASSADVKTLAHRIETDHKRSGDELLALATAKGLNIDPKPTPAQLGTKEKLGKLEGAAFDRAYIDYMVEDHQKDIEEFEKQAASGSDPELKAFAAKVLPALKEHLKMATDLKRALAGSPQ